MSTPAQSLYQKITALEELEHEIPAVIVIHHIETQSVAYMCKRGLRDLQVTQEEIRAMGPAYFHRFFNPQEMDDHIPRIMDLVTRNNDEHFVSYFHQVRANPELDWVWHLGVTKIFMRNEAGHPTHTITFAMPIEPQHHINAKVNRLLEENNFLREYKHVFGALTLREKQVLKLMALGSNSAEMAVKLNISEKTVSTHRRNIKNKLNAQSSYDITRFAQAFDLI